MEVKEVKIGVLVCLPAVLLRDRTTYERLAPISESRREFRCNSVRDFLKRDISLHKFEGSAIQATLLGKVRDIICRHSVEPFGGEHLTGQL